MHLSIRKYRQSDIDALVDIENNCFGGSHEQIAEGAEYWVAVHENRVVGFLSYAKFERSIWLDCVAVHPQFHRQGIGGKLVDRLDSQLTIAQRNKVHCYVRESDLSSQQFFRSLNFRAIRKCQRAFIDEPAYVFRYLYHQPPPVEAANRLSHVA